MINSNETGNYFVQHPTKMRADLGPYSDADLVWTGVIVFVTLIVLVKFPQLQSAIFLSGAIVWWLTMFPFFPGIDERPYELAFVVPLREFRLELKRGKIYEAGDKPITVDQYPYIVREFGDMGLVYDYDRKTYSMVFETEGSTISGENLLTQFGMNQRLGALLRKASAILGLKGLEINFGYDVRPEDDWLVRNNFGKMGDLDVMLPAALNKPEDEWTNEDRRFMNLRQIASEMEDMTLDASKPWMGYVITVKDNRVFRSLLKRKDGFYRKEIRNLPLVRIRETMLAQLGRLTEHVKMLDGFEAESYLRTRRDVAHKQEYYDEEQYRLADTPTAKVVNKTDQSTSNEADEVAESTYDNKNKNAPSSHIIAARDHLTVDDTHIAVIKLTALPEELDQVPVDFIREYTSVFDLPALNYSVDITCKTRKGSVQYHTKDIVTGFTAAFRNFFDANRSGAKKELKERAHEDEMQKLAESSYTTSFIPSIAILNTNAADLEAEVERCMDALDDFNPKRIQRRFRQRREALATVAHIPAK